MFGLGMLFIPIIDKIAIDSAMVALLLTPLSLLVRWLILRRISTAEPAGGASQTQP